MITLTKRYGEIELLKTTHPKHALEFLKENGCDYIQGYYYGRPCPKEEFFDKYINNCENGLTDGK